MRFSHHHRCPRRTLPASCRSCPAQGSFSTRHPTPNPKLFYRTPSSQLTEMTSSGAPFTIWKSFRMNPDGTLLPESPPLEEGGGVTSLGLLSTFILKVVRRVSDRCFLFFCEAADLWNKINAFCILAARAKGSACGPLFSIGDQNP